MNKRGMFAQLIGAVIVIVIGVSLIPMIATEVNKASEQMTAQGKLTNDYGLSTTALKLLPGLFAICVLFAALLTVYNALKSAGFVGGKDDEIAEPEPELTSKEKAKLETKERLEKYEYDTDTTPISKKTALKMTEEDYQKKKEEYEAKMKKFREKKKLSDKDVEKNI